ncbi:MAG TPA: hypothetical protein VHW23_08930 [Kofleriaceae bacterium]|nr:hypothetical protein [Kofleriaceae bacterium]
MKPAIAIAAALAALAAPARLAHAGCAGSGGSGGSASSGGFSDRSWHLHPTCKDTSDVVGLRRCIRFAAWAKNLEYPQIIIEGGALIRQFPTLLEHQIGSVTHGAESFRYHVVQATGAAHRIDTAMLSSLRGSVALSHAVYGGLEVDLGSVVPSGTTATEMASSGTFGSPDLRQDHGLLLDSLGVVGVRAPLGPGGVAVEFAGGLRAVSYNFRSSYHDCHATTSVTALGAVAEARARGELWLGPWLTAGVMLGTSVLERAWMGGIYLGVHTRSFGGDR